MCKFILYNCPRQKLKSHILQKFVLYAVLQTDKKNQLRILRVSPVYRQRLSPILGTIDEFDKEAIRREILAYYERGELPTLDSLLQAVKKPPISFKGGRASLWRLIKSIGFRYKKHCTNRAILMERSDIVAARSKFLRELKLNRTKIAYSSNLGLRL